jgi:DNA-binding PadR family transcriptional regulator
MDAADYGWMFGGKRGRGRPRFDDLEGHIALRHVRGGPFGGGRGRARRGDVRAALLLLLAEEPRNGYQLMQAIDERSGGRWRPSPGSVYPALSQLEDEGLIRAIERDATKLYEITDEGRTHLERHGEHAHPWDIDDEPEFKSLSELRSLVGQIGMATMQVAQAGDEQQVARASEVLIETRRTLYRILAEDADA